VDALAISRRLRVRRARGRNSLSGRIYSDWVYAWPGGYPKLRETRIDKIYGVLNTTNLTLEAGGGIDFPVMGQAGTVELRYSLGMVGVAKQEVWGNNWKTEGLDCLMGLRW
jgi:hypothetical protein